MRISSSLQNIAILFAVMFLLILAVLPWIIQTTAAPLIPEALLATPTTYAIAVGTQTAATATKRAQKSRQELVVGTTNTEIQIFRCPGDTTPTDTRIPTGTIVSILGWVEDEHGAGWFLIRDDVGQPQEWIKSEQVSLTPPDYKTHLPTSAKCRL